MYTDILPQDFHQIKPVSVPTVVTMGTFDGVHKAHVAILQQVKQAALRLQAQSLIVSYWPHPKTVLAPLLPSPKMLHSLEERHQQLFHLGLDHIIHVHFTPALADLSAEAYLKDFLLKKIHAKAIVIGHDHTFGKDKKGNKVYLLEQSEVYGFEVIEINKILEHEALISSSTIRKALQSGNIDLANQLLGYHYTIQGKVIKGRQLGRTISFPTANIQLTYPEKLVPQIGVYIGWLTLDNFKYKTMVNIGTRPTIETSDALSIEAHILDFEGDIYGKYISIEFVKKIRDEKKFESLQSLKAQLENDKLLALELISN